MRFYRAFRVRAVLVSGGGVPSSPPAHQRGGGLPGAKRAGSSSGRGATNVHQNGTLTVHNTTGLELAVIWNNGKQANCPSEAGAISRLALF